MDQQSIVLRAAKPTRDEGLVFARYLDEAAKNERARRFYERYGMAVASPWPKRLPLPAFRLYQMTKELWFLN